MITCRTTVAHLSHTAWLVVLLPEPGTPARCGTEVSNGTAFLIRACCHERATALRHWGSGCGNSEASTAFSLQPEKGAQLASPGAQYPGCSGEIPADARARVDPRLHMGTSGEPAMPMRMRLPCSFRHDSTALLAKKSSASRNEGTLEGVLLYCTLCAAWRDDTWFLRTGQMLRAGTASESPRICIFACQHNRGERGTVYVAGEFVRRDLELGLCNHADVATRAHAKRFGSLQEETSCC